MSSSSPIQKVLIVGATGLLGPHLVSVFDADAQFHVSILTRQSSSRSRQFPPHITIHTVSGEYDKSESELVKIFTGQDAIISAIAAQAVPQQRVLIDAAVKAGVKHFVPSEYGHDTRNEQAAQLLPPFFVTHKRQVVEYLQSKEVEGLKWTAFVTGYDFSRKHAMILKEYGDYHWSTTTFHIAALAVKNAMLMTSEKIANRYLFVESFNVSQKGILCALEELTSTKWDVSYHDAEEERRVAVEKLSRGNFSAIPTLMRYVTCARGYGGDYMCYEESANDLLSLPEESLRSALTKLLN
ncbi:isoflavone reductase family protein [Aspergillus homomorphus CBS 101889]|uniref:NAD(P)-binding protein n=1 Tax=Aspergillus homomorphus (strain CBS 101889) TaxID=1450537 RepID=A0A395HS05_ASPHC|nr:NAD(P)-binding protein [Aspergillus homomorphus CBS 101889]RAL10125.1 NAD(P)-binding protein [Aspergillus homomorphus CBS 101889]